MVDGEKVVVYSSKGCGGGDNDRDQNNEEDGFLLEYTYLIPLTPQMLLVALQWESARKGEPTFTDVMRFVSDNFSDILYPSELENEVRSKLDVLVALNVVRLVRGRYELTQPFNQAKGRLNDETIARFWQVHAFRRTRLDFKTTQTDEWRGLRKRVHPESDLLDPPKPKVQRTESARATSHESETRKWETYIG